MMMDHHQGRGGGGGGGELEIHNNLLHSKAKRSYYELKPARSLAKRTKDVRKKIMKMSVKKLKAIEDHEVLLRKSVLINNTMKTMQTDLREEREYSNLNREEICHFCTPSPPPAKRSYESSSSSSSSCCSSNTEDEDEGIGSEEKKSKLCQKCRESNDHLRGRGQEEEQKEDDDAFDQDDNSTVLTSEETYSNFEFENCNEESSTPEEKLEGNNGYSGRFSVMKSDFENSILEEEDSREPSKDNSSQEEEEEEEPHYQDTTFIDFTELKPLVENSFMESVESS